MAAQNLSGSPAKLSAVGGFTCPASAASSFGGTSFQGQSLTGVAQVDCGNAAGLRLTQLATRSGVVVANNAVAVPVANVSLTASSVIILSPTALVGANAGQARISAFAAGAAGTGSFSIVSGAADTSTYRWMVIDTA